MSKVIGYLDSQSNIELLTNFSLHSSDIRNTEILLLLNGSAKLIIEDVEYLMNSNDLIVINRYEKFYLTNLEKKSLLFRFSVSDMLLMQALEVDSVQFNCNSMKDENKSYDLIRENILEVIDLLIYENEKTNFLQMSKIYNLLGNLSSFFVVYSSNSVIIPDERLAKVKRIINEKYFENLSLKDMANLVHMDAAYFSKLFKKNQGVNFKDYLSNIRMNYAMRDLLETTKPITRLAVDNGFFSVNSFNKKFKEIYGVTPSDYREKSLTHISDVSKESISEIKQYYEEYKEEKLPTLPGEQTSLYLEMNNKELKAIKPTWHSILNIGESNIVLNNNLRKHLLLLQEKIDFEYGRIWSLFEKNILGDTLSHFELVDEILDSLVEVNLLPWITINKSDGLFKESNYDFVEWENTLEKFCSHILNRYGRKQLNQWKFEIVYENGQEISEFCDFYQLCYKVIKNNIPDVMVGGCSLSIVDDIQLEDLVKNKMSDCYFDYYSFSLFPYSSKRIREKRNIQRITNADFLLNMIGLINKVIDNKPVYISEWSNTVSRSNLLNDTLYKGAFIIKNMIDAFDYVDGLGYWLGTDLAHKKIKGQALLTGGSGLINNNGLFKPAMHAMIFLNQLKETSFLLKNEKYLVSAIGKEEIFILGHQYTHPNSLYFLKDESKLKRTEIDNFFEKKNKEVQIVLSNIPNGTYELRIFSCLKEHGNLFRQWEKFNFTTNMRASDLSYLDSKNNHLQMLEQVIVKDNRLVINKSNEINEFYLINIKKRQ